MTNQYTTVQGDFFDLISFQVYGSERYASTLMRCNPAWAAVVAFDAGVVLTVPQVATSTPLGRVPWSNLSLIQ